MIFNINGREKMKAESPLKLKASMAKPK